MKVYMTPGPGTAPTDNGIGRIIQAMGEYLPEYGVHFTSNPSNADVVAFHAGTALGSRVDVLHCHGLYWSDLDHFVFTRSNNEANQRIVAAARRAKLITVPSNWVAEAFRRDMRIEPEIIGHGINVQEWTPRPHQGYTLWNKNRPTDVCDPSPAWKLADKGVNMVSTFGPPGRTGLNVIGNMPFEDMKPIIERAEIYLATAPETFGIGTLEAMVCGVPVLGYNWCGTSELVKHKETGWLCPVGDIDGLKEGHDWLVQHRDEIGANARSFALGFDWSKVMIRYLDVYERASKPEPIGVSIIITNYNYGRWVGEAIKSCLWQTVPPDEIIVVDDGSTDGSLDVIKQFEGRIQIIAQENQGVAAARNNGIRAATKSFIVCLDADDMLDPAYISALKPSLIADRGLGVAYPGLGFISEDGKIGSAIYKEFAWEAQAQSRVPPPTCIPSGSMFRKSMWERCGGYRQKYAPGEDAEFWTHGLSLGFTAEMVTAEALFWYRGHEGSASRTKKYVAIDDNKPWMRDRMYPMGAPARYVPNVRSYYKPLISVVIPLGTGHETLVEDAIESVIGQTVREWELILVDDTGEGKGSETSTRLKKLYPFLRYFYTTGNMGAGFARNLGIEKAKGTFLLFLDADDWLHYNCIDDLLQECVKSGRYAFSDFYLVKGGESSVVKIMPYDREVYRQELVMHSVTALVPTEWAREVQGFDPSLPGWEEFDFYMRLAIKGYCGSLVRQPLFFYRSETGTRRKTSQSQATVLRDKFRERYEGVEMAPCCGGGKNAVLDAKRALGLVPRETLNVPELPNEVRLEFTGAWLGPVAFQVNGRVYYGAADGLHRFINVPKEDVEKLLQSGKWRFVQPPPGSQSLPPPQPEPEHVPPAQYVIRGRG